MKHSSLSRLCRLRALFSEYRIDGIIIPTSDPHLSEYTASHWKFRKWISGFSGSAGTVVVLKDKAGLWTDSRYFIQAAEQLDGSTIDLYKEKLPETPTIENYIKSNFSNGACIGIDNRLFSASQVKDYRQALSETGITLKSCTGIVDKIWADRPAFPDSKVEIYPLEYAGIPANQKINSIRQKLKGCKAKGILLSALDEIAWTLNIRGKDVHCNPDIISFLLITENSTRFYIHRSKLTDEATAYFSSLHIEISNYEDIYQDVVKLKESPILVDPNKINDALYTGLQGRCIDGTSPIALLKAIRNKQEISGIHSAMRKDGVAMTKFIYWLQSAIESGNETEISVSNKLHDLRAEQPLFQGDSFDTIAGYDKHAAIVHYSATPESDIKIEPHGFLLVDSGAQYLDGTTDITRTFAMGQLTDDERIDYTLILKGHIDLAQAVFPAKTTGGQLDVLARMPIWKHHKNFLHGTGHGVGHYLSVHEGPQSIRMEQNPTPLVPGMLTSNEPGIYIEGKHGIRIENLTLVVDDGEGMFGNYYKFETVTLCPIDKRPIVKDLLNEEEITWLNDYHQKVFELISPSLNEDEKSWLRKATDKL
jgi:Xaa-Pro aminopeptidase